MWRFHCATKGAVESYVIPVSDCLRLYACAVLGDATATALANSIRIWAREAAQREATAPNKKFACLNCDTQFGPSTGEPVAFSITMPFADQSCAIVTGICGTCVDGGEELQRMALRHLRVIWPDAYSVERGPTQ